MRPSTLLILFAIFYCSSKVLGWAEYPPSGYAMQHLRNDVQLYENAVRHRDIDEFKKIFKLKNPRNEAEITREMARYQFKKLQVTTASFINTTMIIGKLRVTDAQGHADPVLHDIATVWVKRAKSPTGMKILYIGHP